MANRSKQLVNVITFVRNLVVICCTCVYVVYLRIHIHNSRTYLSSLSGSPSRIFILEINLTLATLARHFFRTILRFDVVEPRPTISTLSEALFNTLDTDLNTWFLVLKSTFLPLGYLNLHTYTHAHNMLTKVGIKLGLFEI